MIEVVGKTREGLLIVKGVYSFYETEGLPLDVLFETLRNKGMIPDWPTFVLEAVEARMKVLRILSMLDAAIADSYGPSMRDVVLWRLRSMTSADDEDIPEATLKLYVLPEEYEKLFAIAARDTNRPKGEVVNAAIRETLGQAVLDRMHGHVVGIVIVDALPDDRFAPV
jgi:hypothetical protein